MTTAGQYIDYDALALEALRGVVKACLTQVARTGLVGEHHFYIAFDTQAPGVGLSKRLKEKYPQEMTIVLQHRFWGLTVTDERFEVELTFDGIHERLVIPFKAITVFYDPSVPYGLQFGEASTQRKGAEGGAHPGPAGVGKAGLMRPMSPFGNGMVGEETDDSQASGGHRASRRPRSGAASRRAPVEERTESGDKAADEAKPGREAEAPAAPKPASPKPAAVVAVVEEGEEAQATEGGNGSEGDSPNSGGAKIFDLAKFRSKK
ncbi:MAG: SspB family protein [Hyphomicrobiaceae bacterium]